MARHFRNSFFYFSDDRKGRPRRLVFDFFFWQIELVFLLADLIGLPEWYELAAEWAKFKTRPLSADEKALARSVFGASIDLERVRVDERAHLGPQWGGFAYVSCSTINSWQGLSPSTFIHEMTHVWQWSRVGSVYIPRALWAQRTAAGYDYGGHAAIAKALSEGRDLLSFNYEQQADIVADYWRLKNGLPPRWSGPSASQIEDFRRLVRTCIPETG